MDANNIRKVEISDRPRTRKKDDEKYEKRRKWSEVTLCGEKMWLTEEVPEGAIKAGVKITHNCMGHFHMHIPITTPWDDLPGRFSLP